MENNVLYSNFDQLNTVAKENTNRSEYQRDPQIKNSETGIAGIEWLAECASGIKL